MMKRIRIQYFAVLREQAGISDEEVETDAESPDNLYRELKDTHGFSLDAAQLKVAINGDFAPWNSPLADGDTVVFIPPVAGG